MAERKYETETMIKLYLHDEHVGYLWIRCTGKGILVTREQILDCSGNMQKWFIYNNGYYSQIFDSFRPGIELPDGKGWLFDGDKVKRTWMGYKCIETGRVGDERRSMTLTATGTLKLGEYGWWIEGESGNPFYVGHTRIWKWDELTLVDG